MFTALPIRNRSRRGVTLVEMLVVIALVVLMMVILVQIFQSALGAMSASRTTQELDVTLRQIDSILRSDLAGVTAKMTPPNDPALKQGYFEYGENAPADIQGEDTDDFLAFTTKAPEGQFFTGRQYLYQVVNNVSTINNAIQPATITSQVAEVIYFLRNGNLYRRVLLVVPDRTKSLVTGTGTAGSFPTPIFGNMSPSVFTNGPFVSWQGLNDVSARPGGFDATGNNKPPILNDLGDLTNRENRAFRPRFLSDLFPKDGIPDDNNADGLPDYYPTMYYNGIGHSQKIGNTPIGWAPNYLVNEVVPYPQNGPSRVEPTTGNSYDVYAFPFIFPGMYSVPDPDRLLAGLGWEHHMYPYNKLPQNINHSPLDIGETPPNLTSNPPLNLTPTGAQTWWGFPTWRETMSGPYATTPYSRLGWVDPVVFLGSAAANGTGYVQPLGLKPFPPYVAPSLTSTNFLPPVYQPGTSNAATIYLDKAGSWTFVAAPLAPGSTQPSSPNPVWEDDLILTNVRSFDVKALDPDAPLYNNLATQNIATTNYLFSVAYLDLGYGGITNGLVANGNGYQAATPFQGVDANGVSLPPVGFGHEGRIPPIFADYRNNPKHYNFNVGEQFAAKTQPNIIRLTHTFDTWSTAYTNAPDTDILLNGYVAGSNPIYPSFPAPYPSPLRGIQIQIRVTDPRNERTKVLTIAHDFTDKL